MYLDKPQLHPLTSTSIPHYWIPSHLSTQHPHLPMSRQSLCRQYRLVAYRYLLLHPKHITHLLHAKSSTSWGRLLFASRGALALLKCFHYLGQWQWTLHGLPVMSQTTDSPTTVLKMTSGRLTFPTLIPSIETFTCKCILGARLALDGSLTQ